MLFINKIRQFLIPILHTFIVFSIHSDSKSTNLDNAELMVMNEVDKEKSCFNRKCFLNLPTNKICDYFGKTCFQIHQR